jgi:hypothetical protein
MFQKCKTFPAYLASPDGQSQFKQQIEPSLRSNKENQVLNKENQEYIEGKAAENSTHFARRVRPKPSSPLGSIHAKVSSLT